MGSRKEEEVEEEEEVGKARWGGGREGGSTLPTGAGGREEGRKEGRRWRWARRLVLISRQKPTTFAPAASSQQVVGADLWTLLARASLAGL